MKVVGYPSPFKDYLIKGIKRREVTVKPRKVLYPNGDVHDTKIEMDLKDALRRLREQLFYYQQINPEYMVEKDYRQFRETYLSVHALIRILEKRTGL